MKRSEGNWRQCAIGSASLRVLLLGLLPVVAAVIYIEGQSYDSALIAFDPVAERPPAALAFLPEKLEGFKRAGQARVFNKDNLYEYVNGHAEYFISAGFAGLAVGDYSRAAGASDLVAEIYDMGRVVQAWGVFADEKATDEKPVDIGRSGYRSRRALRFVRGRYYVKLTAFSEGVSVEAFAKRIDAAMASGADAADIFARLPVIGESLETRFVREAYRGLDFARDVLERRYRLNGKEVTVALVGGRGDAKKLVSDYLAFFDESQTSYARLEAAPGSDVYRVADPYEGDWILLARPDAVFGIYGDADDERTMILRAIEEQEARLRR